MTAGKIEQLTGVTHDTPQECIDILERKVAALEAENATLRKLVQRGIDAETAAHNSEQKSARLEKALTERTQDFADALDLVQSLMPIIEKHDNTSDEYNHARERIRFILWRVTERKGLTDETTTQTAVLRRA